MKHPARAGIAIASDPLEAWITIEDAFAKRRERLAPPALYKAEQDWECRLHNLLGLPWPCPIASEFWVLWPEIINELKHKGIRVGPKSFYSWNDGDAGLVRAWRMIVSHDLSSNASDSANPAQYHQLDDGPQSGALEPAAISSIHAIDC
jgi:hypothetical protein